MPLADDSLATDPLEQFRAWFEEAVRSGEVAEAVALATATPDGRPSVRMVLLKGADRRGLAFFTSYASRKAVELEANPRAALAFYWPSAGRQVRAEGRVQRLAAEESAAYFATRPRESRLAAWASPQSSELASRDALERLFAEAAARFPEDVPLPASWGGYLLLPEAWEFWQRGEHRLHDRFRFERRPDGRWHRARLAP